MHYITLQLQLQLHYTTLRCTTRITLHNATTTTTLFLRYTTLHYTIPHYTIPHYSTQLYSTLRYANYTTPQLQLQLQLHYTHYTTLQLQLRYTTLQLQPQLRDTTLPPAVVVRWPLQPLQPLQKHNSNHLSVHQWVRSAIRDSQQPTSPIGFLFLKLPPPPCAVMLFQKNIYMYIYIYKISYVFLQYINSYIYIMSVAPGYKVLCAVHFFRCVFPPCVEALIASSSPTTCSELGHVLTFTLAVKLCTKLHQCKRMRTSCTMLQPPHVDHGIAWQRLEKFCGVHIVVSRNEWQGTVKSKSKLPCNHHESNCGGVAKCFATA